VVIGSVVAGLMLTASVEACCGGTASAADEAAVRAAVSDYVDSIYQVQPAKVHRSVAPDLNKLGVTFKRDGTTSMPRMSYDELLEVAKKYNVAGRIPPGAIKQIRILDIQSHISNARLEAEWGVDYLLLTKDQDGRWQIRQVLWQAKR